MHATDTLVQQFFSNNRTELFTNFFYTITTLFDLSFSFVLIAFCVAVLIYLFRNIKYSILFVSSLSVATLMVYFLKVFFDVSRPTDSFYNVYGQSFPSYHATIVAVFFVMLMYIFHGSFKSRLSMIFNGFSISFIFLVSTSRLYLGVHWLTDVLAGVILGLVISHVSIFIFRKYFKDL